MSSTNFPQVGDIFEWHEWGPAHDEKEDWTEEQFLVLDVTSPATGCITIQVWQLGPKSKGYFDEYEDEVGKFYRLVSRVDSSGEDATLNP